MVPDPSPSELCCSTHSVKASDHGRLHHCTHGNDVGRCPQGQLLQLVHIPHALEGICHLEVQPPVYLVLLPPVPTTNACI